MNSNCVKVINSGEIPEFLIYEHDEKILIYKISKEHMLKKSDRDYQLFNAFPCKIIGENRE